MTKGIPIREFDFITYWAGTKFKSLGGVKIIGPKCENNTNDYNTTISIMLKNKEKLKNLGQLPNRN